MRAATGAPTTWLPPTSEVAQKTKGSLLRPVVLILSGPSADSPGRWWLRDRLRSRRHEGNRHGSRLCKPRLSSRHSPPDRSQVAAALRRGASADTPATPLVRSLLS